MDNTQDLAALKAATVGAQQLQAANNPANPLGATAGPELAQASAGKFAALPAAASATAQGNIAQQQVAAAKAQQAALSDPSKYTRVKAPDGGYNFYDPTGKPISAKQYADVNQTTEDKVLAGSQNPIDLAYQQDFKQLQRYYTDKLNSKSDPQAAQDAANIEKQVQKAYGINLANQDFQHIAQTFQQAYPTVYGLNTTGPQGTHTFLPSDYALLSPVQQAKKNAGL